MMVSIILKVCFICLAWSNVLPIIFGKDFYCHGDEKTLSYISTYISTSVIARDIMATDNVERGMEELANLYTCSDFKDLSLCFAKLHMSVNSKIDTLEKKVNLLETKTTDLEKYTDYVEASFTSLKENVVVRLDNAIVTEKREREDSTTEEAKERLKLEMWGRKWNLVFRGIAGTTSENPAETERKIRAFLLGTLGFDSYTVGHIIFAAVHRLPGGYGPQKKNILVRFVKLSEEVMKKISKIKPGSEISIVPDVPAEVSGIRSELLKKRKEMSKEEKTKHKLIYMKDYPFVKLIRKQENKDLVSPKKDE